MNNNSKFMILNSNELLQVNGGEQTFGSVMKDIGDALVEGITGFAKTIVSDEFRKPFTSVMKITYNACSVIAKPSFTGGFKAGENIKKEWDKLSSYAE